MEGQFGGGAFGGCSSLVSVSLPAVTSIGNNAFSGCTSLTRLDLPVATSFGNDTFSGTGIGALTITLGATIPTVVDNIFDLTSYKPVTFRVPISEVTVYQTAWDGKDWGGNISVTITGF